VHLPWYLCSCDVNLHLINYFIYIYVIHSSVQNHLTSCGLLLMSLGVSIQIHVSINLPFVQDVFKARQKQSLITAREELKSKY
jgi:hypothetical protein